MYVFMGSVNRCQYLKWDLCPWLQVLKT